MSACGGVQRRAEDPAGSANNGYDRQIINPRLRSLAHHTRPNARNNARAVSVGGGVGWGTGGGGWGD